MCVVQGVFSNVSKISKVVPIHKKGPKNLCANYRPISIIPTVSKVFERLIHNQLNNYLELNGLLSKSQFGFRPKHSTVNAVSSLISDCYKGLECHEKVVFRSFDLSKAFDTVDHCVLVNKLAFYLSDNLAVNFFKPYLEGRQQAICTDGIFSKTLSVPHGVPQGSILGPTLFIVYINDLPSNLANPNVNSFLFADDLGLNVRESSVIEANNALEDKTKIVVDWCCANRLSLNAEKVQDLTLSLSSKKEEICSLKFLGIFLQTDLKWENHIDNVAAKLAKGLFLLRSLKSSVTPDILLSIYYAYIQSHLSYGISLWGNSGYSKKVFILQKKAIRLICGTPAQTHCKPLFVYLGVLSLPSLYVLSTLLYVKENINKLNDSTSVHNFNTRYKNNLSTKRCMYTSTQNSFEYMGIKMYNVLPDNIKKLPYNNFKSAVKSLLVENCLYEVSEYFNIIKSNFNLKIF
uniref:Reverse transcriptase domain-containing protein n=1 Tax=Graphocephala atropunctata TaxID=36148 RepID=A0A1B6KI47_9HEMI